MTLLLPRKYHKTLTIQNDTKLIASSIHPDQIMIVLLGKDMMVYSIWLKEFKYLINQ